MSYYENNFLLLINILKEEKTTFAKNLNMNFLQKYWDKQKKKSWWSLTFDILFILLFVGLLIPTTRTPIMVFIKELTNFAPSVSADDHYGKLSAQDYEWTLLDENNQKVKIKDLADKPIFINFWATWCPPCLAEMPSMIRLQKDYEHQIHFVLISQENQSITKALLEEKNWDLKSFRPLNKTPETLSSSSLPTTFIINKEGVIVVKETGNKKWDSNSVRELLDELLE